MRITYIILATLSVTLAAPSTETSASSMEELNNKCDHKLTKSNKYLDYPFWKKFFKHWVPFTSSSRVKMQFFLFKKDFPDCGRELFPGDDETLENSGFDSRHPTRIIIHGWMSQGKGSLNRDVKTAYLSLTKPRPKAEGYEDNEIKIPLYEDFNIVVCDWSKISSNVNYFGVADMVEDLGFLLAEFVRHLHMRAGLNYDDVYLIGHSLGAQIAGSAGKQIKPYRFNTIYALDPAGPAFRDQSDEYRVDASDAHYVESIQTSTGLGFEQPVGHASFYPNFGKDQKKCYMYGCSHKRAHDYFAESINSTKGFWGIRCERMSRKNWVLLDNDGEFRMGGEPSNPKNGTFYVKTYDKPPYAMGKREELEKEPLKEEVTTVVYH
ncbi:phospholipase A1 [Drosophila sulfurigaster albostrigata]|uniref:phospholipase A1 n=1 Tax=Drosophila sulfurigaster albostrigata TaxID=89887 RepID=UPI002D21D0CC|nr:phospholipase A1 [Drosophila sulfurigaster albostrigata]